MARFKGKPSYTQKSIAWPDPDVWPDRSDREVDEISVSFDAKGGGTHGEFRFVFVELDRYVACKVQCFTDGLGALGDERIQKVLAAVKRREKRGDPEVTPKRMIRLLEQNGVRPSRWHLRGLTARKQNDGDQVSAGQLMAVPKPPPRDEWDD